jgi:hypothetical protein
MEAKRDIDSLRRKLRARAARNRASIFVLCIVGTLAILATLSWSIVEKVVPPVYAARATLKADGQGRMLTQRDLAEWQDYHEQLLSDTGFLEFAAGRMARRGIESLSQPGALREHLAETLDHQSGVDGRLTLELHGQGRDKTERILDTIITAIASRANATRDMRADAAATVIESAAVAGAEPVEDNRLFVTAGVLAIGLLFCIALGIALWRVLARSMSSFTQETQADALLSQAEWVDVDEAIEREAA